MARYRPIYTKIWKDPRVQELNADDKLLFIYLLTNELLNESGVYPITSKTIANETGLKQEGVDKGLTRGLKGFIEYDSKNQVVWVKNFFKYQPKSPNMLKSVQNDIKHIKSKVMDNFIKHYNLNPNAIPNLNPIPNPIGGFANPLKTPSKEGKVKLSEPQPGETIEQFRERIRSVK